MSDPLVDQQLTDATRWARRYERWRACHAAAGRVGLARWAEERRDGQLAIAVTLVMLHGEDGGYLRLRQVPP